MGVTGATNPSIRRGALAPLPLLALALAVALVLTVRIEEWRLAAQRRRSSGRAGPGAPTAAGAGQFLSERRSRCRSIDLASMTYRMRIPVFPSLAAMLTVACGGSTDPGANTHVRFVHDHQCGRRRRGRAQAAVLLLMTWAARLIARGELLNVATAEERD